MWNDTLKRADSVLLISCYELGHQPLGLAVLAAFLERAGFPAACLDLAVEDFDPDRIRKAGFVGISVPMHTALRLGLKAARRVRETNPECHVCFFGLYALLNARYLLERVADSVIGGEYEGPLTELVSALADGKPLDIEGIATREKASAPYLKRLSFPVPDLTKLPALVKYARLETPEGFAPAGYVEASRGCRHLFLHCPIPPVYGGRFFVTPRETVLEEVRQLVQMGSRHITFGDPDFLNAPSHSLRSAKVIHEEFPFLSFDFTAKIEHLLKYERLLDEFARCGCLFIVSAAESLSDTVLTNLKKGHTRGEFFKALRRVRDAGIILRPSFVSFTPWTTLEDYIEILDVALEENLLDCIDLIQYAVRLLVPPGSYLLSSPAMQPFLGPLRRENFTYSWVHPDPRMDDLYRDVTSLLQRSVAEGQEPGRIYACIRELAEAARDSRAPQPESIDARPHVGRAVRLTEPWFC